MGVPPGSRVTRYGTPERSSRAANLCICVDFPHPSDPSNVMNGSRGMISIVKQSTVIVERVSYSVHCLSGPHGCHARTNAAEDSAHYNTN